MAEKGCQEFLTISEKDGGILVLQLSELCHEDRGVSPQ